MALGSNVRRLREEAGLTQTELAERAGMDQQALAALEKRDSKSSSFTPALAAALGVSVHALLGIQEVVANATERPALPGAIDPAELQELIKLYSGATPRGRRQIILGARNVEQADSLGRTTIVHNKSE